MTDDDLATLRDWLRVKYLPVDSPSGDDILRYDHHLSLSPAEQSAAVRSMSDDDAELYISLEVARYSARDPVDRETGITEAKVARYPDRYGRPEDSS